MEKGFGIWSREFTPDYTPAMCGFDRFVDYGKTDFIGREAALADRDAKHEHKLVQLEIDSRDADAWGYEPIWYKDEYAGFVTSGAYGHTVEKSLALGYVKTEFLESSGDEYSVHVVDERRPARILSEAPCDPDGLRMRC
jgi:dimethylglycine dehydrogenase